MTNSDPCLVLEDVDVRPDGKVPPVVRSLSLVVNRGERVALLGRNGAGKTTLLSAIVGLLPHTGCITLNGLGVGPDTLDAVREQTGFLFASPEDQILFPTVEEDVSFALRRKGIPRAKAAEQTVALLRELNAERLLGRAPHQLSHGERLTVALAGTVIANPSLLLLDEPSSTLDPMAKRELAAHLSGRSATMLIASHDLPFLRKCCTRFLLMEHGTLVGDYPTPDPLGSAWDV